MSSNNRFGFNMNSKLVNCTNINSYEGSQTVAALYFYIKRYSEKRRCREGALKSIFVYTFKKRAIGNQYIAKLILKILEVLQHPPNIRGNFLEYN